jgi:hypothetical protein
MELVTFNTIDLRDGQALEVSLKRDIIIGHQTISDATKEELRLNNPGSEKHVKKLKQTIIFYSGSMDNVGFHLVTNTKEELEESGIFEYIKIGKNIKIKKDKVRIDE